MTGAAWGSGPTYVRLYESTDMVNWTLAVALTAEPNSWHKADVPAGYQYVAILDDAGAVNGETSSTFVVYSFKFRDGSLTATSGPGSNGTALYQWKVTTDPVIYTYRHSIDFSSSQGPRWRYISAPSYAPMTWQGTYWQGAEFLDQLSKIGMHPSAAETPTLLWYAPKTGVVSVRLVARDIQLGCGDGVIVTVQQCNTVCITLAHVGIAEGDTLGDGYHGSIPVTSADALWFSTYKNGDNYCDYTSLDPTIVYE